MLEGRDRVRGVRRSLAQSGAAGRDGLTRRSCRSVGETVRAQSRDAGVARGRERNRQESSTRPGRVSGGDSRARISVEKREKKKEEEDGIAKTRGFA